MFKLNDKERIKRQIVIKAVLTKEVIPRYIELSFIVGRNKYSPKFQCYNQFVEALASFVSRRS